MRSLWLIACLLPIPTAAQNWSDSLAARMATWQTVIAHADTITQEEMMNEE